MLVHLSNTSPYVCDLSLGPIEQANRMASASTKQSIPFLELKDSFPRFEFQQTRTPLKLLAPDEIPMDSSIATTTTTTDINTSRQPSLQPVWYTEQTIVDDNNEQRNSMKSPAHRNNLTCSTLPTIESNSPEIQDEIIENELLSNKPLLMRKSSTFTIEQQPSINIPSTLNESEKENDANVIITSTQEDPTRHPSEPSDESFRALEHLLGLGSTNINLTMTTTAQESPKSNHESLSLTIVTPTDLINQTGNSFHLSYAPAGGGSLPSSQNILLMPTIESITEPSINSTIPPPFLVDNSDMEEPSSSGGTIINQESQNEHSNCTEGSFRFTDEDEEKQELPKDDTNTEEENNFSFELNDFPNNSNDNINQSTNSTTETALIPPPIITFRQPTSADVAFRALVKPRTSGRISQPVKINSPLADSNKPKLTVRSSVPTASPTPRERVLRSSSRRISTDISSQNSTIQDASLSNSIPNDECFVNENKIDDDYPRIELVEVVSLPEEDELEEEKVTGITLNLTSPKDIIPISPTSAEEADCSASSSSSSSQQDIATPTEPMIPVLSREFTYNTPTATTRSSERRRSIITNRQSYSRSIHSSIPSIKEQQTPITEEEDTSSENLSIYSIKQSMLSRLSTNPTAISEAPAIILQKSLAGSASPSPNPTPTILIRKNDRLSSNFSPRQSINPLHSSTPSIRNKSLQMVSIGEQEQVSTTVPRQLNIDITAEDIEMNDNEQQVDITINIQHVTDEGIQTSPEQPIRRIDVAVQTTPSLDPSSRRLFNTIEQQTTPVLTRSSSSSSCQTTPVPIAIQRTNIQQTSPVVQSLSITKMIIEEHQQITPLHTKAMMHLRRNVRFQFTPSTDARLTAKEKEQEEDKQHRPLKQDLVISDNEREEDTEDEVKQSIKTKKKMNGSKKKKLVLLTTNDESSEEMNESPVQQPTRRITRNKSQKDTTDDEQLKSIDTHVTSTTISKKKTSKQAPRQEKIASPIKELPVSEPEIIVTATSPTLPTKRANRKRSKATTVTPPETISPTEPVMKRAKTTKIIEVKQPEQVPSSDPRATRTRSKTPVLSKTNIKPTSSPKSIERPPTGNPSRKAKKTSLETSSVENPSISTNNKRKNPAGTIKKGKRRLHSVEQDEGLNTADEEETIQTISLPVEIIPVNNKDLSQEEREKIEAFTVIELKTRLTTHGENIPKGARKADLVALLIKIETNLLKERKEAESVAAAAAAVAAVPANTTSRKTRRKK